MSHVRLQLRNALKSGLGTALNGTTSVFVNRADPLQDNELPAVLIMVNDEKVERMSQDSPALMQRMVQVQIDIFAKLANGFDDALENIATIIEKTLGASPPLAALAVKDLMLTSATKSKPNGEGQDDLVALRLDYQALLLTRENDPSTLI